MTDLDVTARARGVQPALIAIGGPPGSGKTTLSRRLAAAWHLPWLAADHLGPVIATSPALADSTVNAYWLAYDVLFALADELLGLGLSAVLDLNLGWSFQWQRLDALRQQHPQAQVVPVVLRCPRPTCLARLGQRYAADPASNAPPSHFATDPRILEVVAFLDRLHRPDAVELAADQTMDVVYADLTDHLQRRLRSEGSASRAAHPPPGR